MMWISSRDIEDAIKYLESEYTSGGKWLTFNKSEAFLRKDCMMAFVDWNDALAYSYDQHNNLDFFRIEPIEPILEGLVRIKSSSIYRSDDNKNDFSLPFDIPTIVAAYNFSKEFKILNMKEKNLEYLEGQLKYTGMGEIPREKLIENIKDGQENFVLGLEQSYGPDSAKATLHFRKSNEDYYFFNSFDMTVQSKGMDSITATYKVKKPVAITKIDSKGVEQKEWVNATMTFKEAANQCMGRAVNKDYVKVDKEEPNKNEKYNVWEVLDFKNPDDQGNYPVKRVFNFDIEKVLADYPIKELETEGYKKDLINSLQRGNRQIATFKNASGEETKFYIEAHPVSHTLKIYDANMMRVNLSMKKPKEQLNQGIEGAQNGMDTPASNQTIKEGSQPDKIEPGGDKSNKERNNNDAVKQPEQNLEQSDIKSPKIGKDQTQSQNVESVDKKEKKTTAKRKGRGIS